MVGRSGDWRRIRPQLIGPTQDPVHDLRHTDATTLRRESVHPSVASKRLCRSSAASMMATYRHGVRRILVEAAALLAAAVFESRELRYA